MQLQRKVLKAPSHIFCRMAIFEKAADWFRRFNAARAGKSIERLLSRSKEFAEKFEEEAKRFGISVNRLIGANHYEALGIAYTSDQRAIKEAYQKLMKKHHPDVSKAADAEEIAKKINEAYAVLKDERLKLEYDRNSSKGKSKVSADAMRCISRELMRHYAELREADFKRFREATSVPLQRDVARAAIEEVCDWNKRLDRASKAAFGDLRHCGKTIMKLNSTNTKLLKKESGEKVNIKLQENGRRLEELSLIYKELDNCITTVAKNSRREISAQESKATARLRSMI